jgi:hypothetical protein
LIEYTVCTLLKWGHRGRDRMVVGFITTYMQSVPIITTNVVSSKPAQQVTVKLYRIAVEQFVSQVNLFNYICNILLSIIATRGRPGHDRMR